MSDAERFQAQLLAESLSGVAGVEVYPVDVDAACREYLEEGYEVTPWLQEFLANYGECIVTWQFRGSDTSVSTRVEHALEAPHATPRNMQIFSRRLGLATLPIGSAFSTEECMLLAANGDILLAGDPGFQWVAHGFHAAAHALVAGPWDRTFYTIAPAEDGLRERLTQAES
ncbi:SUKH-3 domain-containing protein [Streptomyces durbertensis]|uniref:SUKH-3 domain-containing protein n=1 Tax=Streptomyces durbertensis TaxID=2448886 RepID=A0ABR6EKQ7_9ACTN|nr:SUKH-3 domain-containing protein [Streptomyces durbertensis]MBB1245911.1 SUKH-3 domain-containing protein [Streptomyces durbertensis]